MIIEQKEFVLDGKKVFERIILKPPFAISNDMPDEACFLHMERGECEINSPTEHLVARAQEAVLMRCGSYFTEYLRTHSSETCESIIIHLYPDILRKIFDRELTSLISSLQSVSVPGAIRTYANDKLFTIYIESVKVYFDTPSLVTDDVVSLKLKELVLLLMKTDKAPSIGQLLSSLFSQREYSFREVIEAHLFTGVSIEKLAPLTHMSLSSFKREFNKVFNDSPAHYFKTKRLERSAELLKLTSARIGDIAFECGFNDLAHFTKSFQAKYSVSPSQFRLNQKTKPLSRTE